MHIFDAQCGIGGAWPGTTDIVGVDVLLSDMKRADVQRALVRIEPTQQAFDIPAVNESLYDMCALHQQLVPCPVVAPNAAGDLGSERHQVDVAIEHGAGAVFVRPSADKWSASLWGCRPLMEALDTRRMPVFCAVAELSVDAVAALAEEYPQVPFILAGAGYRDHRVIAPLLQTFPNVHLVVGSTYIVFHGIESFMAEARVEQLLLGSGYSQFDLLPAVAYVMYASMAEDERALIAGGNLERLIQGIER